MPVKLPGKRQRLKVIDVSERKGGPRAAVVAARFVLDADREVRVRAFESLRDHGDRRWVDSALAGLRDAEDTVVATAIECLVYWDVHGATGKLLPLLQSEDELTRTYAAWAIGKLGRAVHIPILRKRFRQVADEVEGSALAEALFMLTQNTRYFNHLLKQLGSRRPHTRAFTSNSLVGAANRKNYPRAICALAQALSVEKSEWVLVAIRDNLNELTSMAIEWSSVSTE